MTTKTIYIICFAGGILSITIGALMRLMSHSSGDILLILGFVLEAIGVAVLIYTEKVKTRA